MFDVDALARQVEREEARIHDDKTFFEEVIAEIEHGFTSVPQLKYNFIWTAFKLGLTYTLRVPPMVLKMLENFRDLLDKISTRTISPVILSVN